MIIDYFLFKFDGGNNVKTLPTNETLEVLLNAKSMATDEWMMYGVRASVAVQFVKTGKFLFRLFF